MYAPLLVLHSWGRWLFVAAAAFAVARLLARGPASRLDALARAAVVGAADLMLLLGAALWALSPYTPGGSGQPMGAVMKDKVLRFFSVEHPFSMVLVVVALHVGSVLARKANGEDQARKRWAMALAVALVLVAVMVPWPWRGAVARPLFTLSPG
jgi:hypothetical protein